MTRPPFDREAVKRVFFALEDRWFDFVHRIETRGVVAAQALQTNSAWKGHANAYHAVWTRNVRALLKECVTQGPHFTAFVDVGCGKGKACFFAATSGLFREIVGIDFDQSLIEAAKLNLSRFKRGRITFRHTDATAFDLMEQPCVVFLFNPFDGHVLRLFLERNIDSFRRNGHVVAYANDISRDVLQELGFVSTFRDSTRKLSVWRLQV